MSVALLTQLIGIATTVLSIYLTGRKNLWGPILGAVGIVPWTIFCLEVQAYPMIGLNLLLTVLHLQVLVRWSREVAA